MFSQKLIAELAPYHLLKHPFYLAWMKGELSLTQLKNYAAQYYPHVLAFPQYVSAVHSQCPDAQIRRSLARNLNEEEGLDTGESHPELWLQFAEGLGLNRSAVRCTEIQPQANALQEGFFKLARASYAGGLGSLFAYEYQVPEVARTKTEGLKKFYGIDKESTVKFFKVHETADLYHSEECKAALDQLSESEQKVAKDAAIQSARLLWDFLSEAYAA